MVILRHTVTRLRAEAGLATAPHSGSQGSDDMSMSAGYYHQLAWLQIRLMRRYIPSTALYLQQMEIAFGAQAAYQAATAVIFLKRHLHQGQAVTDMTSTCIIWLRILTPCLCSCWHWKPSGKSGVPEIQDDPV